MVDVKRLLVSIVIGLGFWALICAGLYMIMRPAAEKASLEGIYQTPIAPDRGDRSGFPFG